MKALLVCLIAFLFMLTGTYYLSKLPKSNNGITIKKSCDSDWEISKERFPDTTITRVVVVGRDTVYPTTIYKNIYPE